MSEIILWMHMPNSADEAYAEDFEGEQPCCGVIPNRRAQKELLKGSFGMFSSGSTDGCFTSKDLCTSAKCIQTNRPKLTLVK